ncbi:carboxymuconolactone decarboxylase family protein [Mesorhizobium sp. M1169]
MKTRERIALAVAQVNGCDYCLSAHTFSALTWQRSAPRRSRSTARARSSDSKADCSGRAADETGRPQVLL